MSLRVLLADESATIKKVIQLSLQSLSVEVKAISMGNEVIEAVKQFKPDIVFVDALLRKMSGYDVASAIKTTFDIHTIPVIIMWSGFVELDIKKFEQSKADDKLEKPFDAETLQLLVHKHVTSKQAKNTQTTQITDMSSSQASKSTYSQQPSVLQTQASMQKLASSPTPDVSSHASSHASSRSYSSTSNWNMDSFENLQQFHDGLLMTTESSPLSPFVKEFDHDNIICTNTNNISINGNVNSNDNDNSNDSDDDEEDHFANVPINNFIQQPLSQRSSKEKEHMTIPTKESVIEFNLSGKTDIDSEIKRQEPLIFSINEPSHEINPSQSSSKSTSPSQQSVSPHSLSQTQVPPSLTRSSPIQPPPPPLTIEPMTIQSKAQELAQEVYASVMTQTSVQTQPLAAQVTSTNNSLPSLSQKELEAIITANSKELIEPLVYKLVPEIATRLIKEELKRLLDDKKS